MKFNEIVRSYWDKEACGTSSEIVSSIPEKTPEWFKQVERYRYDAEPFIHAIAKFTLHHGKKVLEVGVGAGTDHLQWARAGAKCYGIDLTNIAIETTRNHLSLYGFKSDLQRVDAEALPFDDEFFDLVYSWGVIHHAEYPERIVSEIRRVLKPQGCFIGMMYGRRSILSLKMWLKYALLKGKPNLTFKELIWNYMESKGTKAYTISELKEMFSSFSNFTAKPILTIYDKKGFPDWLSQFFPDLWGWFIAIEAIK